MFENFGLPEQAKMQQELKSSINELLQGGFYNQLEKAKAKAAIFKGKAAEAADAVKAADTSLSSIAEAFGVLDKNDTVRRPQNLQAKAPVKKFH